jgi:hypothetical protein
VKNQFTPKRLLFLGALTALVFGFIAWQQTTNAPHGPITFTASRGQFHHYIPHVVVMALIVIVADFFALWYGWKRYTREKTTEPVTDAADARLNPLREVEPPTAPTGGAQA